LDFVAFDSQPQILSSDIEHLYIEQGKIFHCIPPVNQIEFAWRYLDLSTLESIADPSHPLERKVMFRSKLQATMTFILSVPFLFLKGECFSGDVEMGI
jgi:hypothetical protein